MKKTSAKWIIGLLVVCVVAPLAYQMYAKTQPGKLDGFAQCITDSGAKFYGAFWCPHCQAQKRMFGNSEKLLPYIECSTPDGQGQLEICKDAGVTGYPTWEFADGGERLSGEVELSVLAERTACTLPEGY